MRKNTFQIAFLKPVFLKLVILSAGFCMSADAQDAESDSPQASSQLSINKSTKQRGLIVQITVDQFKSDYIRHFRPAFKQGFAKVLEDGVTIINGNVEHAITNSYPGHASLVTGTYPSNHGYSANEWWDYVDGKWRWIDGGIDPKTTFLEDPERLGYSPTNMRVRSLADWVLKADSQAKSVALGSNTTVINYAGKTSEHAYWYDREAGKFVTSTWYRQSYPDWLKHFNSQQLNNYKLTEWTLTVSEELRCLADKDDQDYEDFGNHYTFPHRFADEYDEAHERSQKKQLDYWFYETPMPDLAVFDLAKLAIEAESLGQRKTVDYLSLSLGATDNIGHIYGGRSLEILDTLVLMDQALGGFIDYLDTTIGKNNYILAISGDHGAPNAIERTLQQGGKAYRIPQEKIETLLDDVDTLAEQHKGSEKDLILKIEQRIEAEPYVADAVTEAEVFGKSPSNNPHIDLYRKSWVKGRVPDFPMWTNTPNRPHHPARYGIYVQFNQNTHFGYGMVVHGSPYDYDRQVPILFYGNKLPGNKLPSRVIKNANTIDVAPTLANWMDIPIPGSVDGKVLFSK